MKVKVFTWPSSAQKLKIKVAGLNRKLDEKPPKKINCPVCGNLINKLDTCCDPTDSIQFDDDDIRTLATEPDYD